MNKEHLHIRIFWSLAFSFMFAMIGWAIPELYYKYFDTTQYYTIDQPVSVDKEVYAPCDETVLTVKGNSLVNTITTSAIDLNLVRLDGGIVRIIAAHKTIESSIFKGSEITDITFELPCNLRNGTYFWQGTVRYSVRGLEKFYPFITENFSVVLPTGQTQKAPQSETFNIKNETTINQEFQDQEESFDPTPIPRPVPLPDGSPFSDSLNKLFGNIRAFLF